MHDTIVSLMDEASVIEYITGTFEGVHVVEANGSHFFFYGPMGDNNKLPFATLVTTDEHDQASNLSRPGVFRLNIGVGKDTCRSLFGAQESIEYNFTALDQIMPHPVYGMMRWVCVLSPSDTTFEQVKPLLAEAYETTEKKRD